MKLQGIWRVARCEIAVSISLSPSSPLLIQAPKDDKDNKKETGHAWKKKGDPEKAICVSYERGGKIVYYIPGSSLKGVLRAHTEKSVLAFIPTNAGGRKRLKEKNKWQKQKQPKKKAAFIAVLIMLVSCLATRNSEAG
ncbi:RAMP superfamily CRISPR-associated protein [Geobacillus zalihae]|uniref:RAMP superfamily CRISPR-associated protein n=1 Tax=Geobacillus zalihae TaxID=213419 RepID=UPI001681967F|nr:RAMP superfamily CRISPR-associated protein [Geobacillus zalihae]QNU24355.1 hypothetical protein IC806_15285 [Geobacillus zalihae]